MNHLSLFSGIGGLDLAAEWAGFRTIGFVERDKFCQRVLAKHWPGVPIWDDVCKVTAQVVADAESIERRDKQGHASDGIRRESRGIAGKDGPVVGLISGGFPCQPHSVAGKRQASLDERDLWAECARIVGEFRPRWCVFENVPGLLTSERGTFFARVLGDLAALGYRVGWCVYGAVDVGAPHRRERVFIVANRDGWGREVERLEEHGEQQRASWDIADRLCQAGRRERAAMADANDAGLEGHDERTCAAEPAETVRADAGTGSVGDRASGRLAQSRLGDVADGLSRWLVGPGLGWGEEPDVPRVAVGVKDRVNRLRALGNAVVPQQVYPIFRAIADLEGIYRG
jgi:DNA (cytosine-5)-methyltransferase 1